MSEHDDQCALFEWAEMMAQQYPELDLMFAIPNGGHRYKAVAARLKLEGVKAGVPDIFLPAAKCGHHGLFIELKFGKNKATTKQNWWMNELEKEGYLTAVCWGWTEAAALIESYLEDNNELEY